MHRHRSLNWSLSLAVFVAGCGGSGSAGDAGGGSAGHSGSESAGAGAGAGGGQVSGTGGGSGAPGAVAGNTDGGTASGRGGAAGSGGGTIGGGGQTPTAGGDAGGASAGRGGAAGSGTCVGLICEDFEGGALDSTKWDLVEKGGTLTVQSERVAHGKFAAQAHGQAGPSDDWALLTAKNVPMALKGATTFGRALMYASADAVASIHVQLAFAGHTGAGSATGPAPFPKLRYMEVASYSGRWQLGFDLLDLSPLVEEVSYSNEHIATAAWVCLEWQFEDTPNRVTTWVEGVQVGTFDNGNVAYASPGPTPKPGAALWDGKSSALIGGFDTFGFGFHDWHPQRQFDIYYDDLVLDSKRVGCPAARSGAQ
jgi:hypothetical protein